MRRWGITKDREGKLRDYVQDVQFDGAYFASLLQAKGSLRNLREYPNPATFSGKVLLYTTRNQLVRGSIYKGGLLVSEIFPKETGLGSVGMAPDLPKSYVEVGGGEDVHCGKPECDPVTVTGHRPTPPPPFPLPPLPPVSSPSSPPAPPPPTGGGGGSTNETTEVSTFILSKEDQKKYPRLTEMVKKSLDYVKGNPKVLEALKKYTNLTESEILNKVKFGNSPTIVIKDLGNNYGLFNSKENPNVFNIDAAFVRGLEGAVLQGTIEATSFLLAVTTFHEFVHYARFFNGLDREYEYGVGFERDVYGVTITKENAGKYSWRFYKK